MRRARGASFPRSGHGPLYHALRNYFADELVYCDPDNRKPNAEMCGCRCVPCVNPRNTFSKNHDFGLDPFAEGVHAPRPVDPEERYVVQYRSPMRSIVSNYHLHLRNQPQDATRFGWTRFAHRQIAYWKAFVDKWALPHLEDERFLCLSYERLLARPQETLTEAIGFVSERAPDEARIAEYVRNARIEPRDNSASFEYHDDELFERLEAATGERMEKLGLPSFREGV